MVSRLLVTAEGSAWSRTGHNDGQAMFEFGKDLRRLFEQARASDDLGWLELIGVDLLAIEARQRTTDAGRVSCARPFDAWMQAAAVWREHGRRLGEAGSLDRAEGAAVDAAREARTDTARVLSAIETARCRMLRFDLFGGPEQLDAAVAVLSAAPDPGRGRVRVTMLEITARLRARQAWLGDDDADRVRVLERMDQALRAGRRQPPGDWEGLRLERAALALDLGLRQGDAARLDKAGAGLQAILEDAGEDQRPLTRARALSLCASGMVALGGAARDDVALERATAMFDAATEQFTPDHSPMDWVAIQLAQARSACPPPLDNLVLAEALTEDRGLVLGAVARECRSQREITMAEVVGDRRALEGLRQRLIRRVQGRRDESGDLDWVADQISLARLAQVQAGFENGRMSAAGLALGVAAEVARERGSHVLAELAEGVR